MLIFCGIPLLYMELSVGQYTQQGPVLALRTLSPFFQGLFGRGLFAHALRVFVHMWRVVCRRRHGRRHAQFPALLLLQRHSGVGHILPGRELPRPASLVELQQQLEHGPVLG